MFVSLGGVPKRARSGRERRLAKKKMTEVEDGLKNAAIAVGSVLGSLAQKVGLAPKATKKAVSKAPASKKKAAPQKKAAPKKKAVAKKVVSKKAAAKRPSVKKAKRPAKRA
jgi:hypothetical protein